jgi:hypothetical protein
MREREQLVIEQIPWRPRRFDPSKVSGARDQPRSKGQDFPRDQRWILQSPETKGHVDATGDQIDIAIGDQNLYPNVRLLNGKGREAGWCPRAAIPDKRKILGD